MTAATCRVCAAPLGAPDFDRPAPALSSIRTLLPVATQVYVCTGCGHAQSPDLPALDDFYDTQYRISLDIDGHDQLYENALGEQVFRTQYQAEIVASLDIPQGAKILDFGAGKATTLERVAKARPDLEPHVFDVSTDYVAHWSAWVPEDNQATYALPDRWTGRFDLITAHFVLEHVADPVAILNGLRRCLGPQGRVFFSVPNAETNTGDLLVADHLSHFTRASLERLLTRAGLRPLSIDDTGFQGAFLVVAEAGQAEASPRPAPATVSKLLALWQDTLGDMSSQAWEEPLAIYGAGFYGSMLASCVHGKATAFLDRNPYLQGGTHLDLPVIAPEDCPTDVRTVLVGLNPARARDILGDGDPWLPKGARLVFLDKLA